MSPPVSRDPNIRTPGSIGAEKRYRILESDRSVYLQKARECVDVTLTYLLNQGDTSGTREEKSTPYSSKGAQSSRNLAAKMLTALFPSNEPFLKLEVDKSVRQELLANTEQENFETELDRALGTAEREIMSEVDQTALRVDVAEALEHIVVCGNVLLYLPDKGKQRVFPMDRYVVVRDGEEKPREIVIKEEFSDANLPDELRKYAKSVTQSDYSMSNSANHKVYTWIKWDDRSKKWRWRQEFNDHLIKSGYYKEDELPYVALRGIKVSGEHWGRSLVELYLGDMYSLENLYGSLVQTANLSARILFGIRKGSGLAPKRMTGLPNGGFFMGDEGDIWTLQVDKMNDLRVQEAVIEKLERRLDLAFGSPDSIRRDAERVTAEEIRIMTLEFSETQSALYSILSEELQLPVARLLMSRLRKQDRLPEAFDDDLIKPSITTGVQALGRGNDAIKLQQFDAMVGENPERAIYVNQGDFVLRAANALGIDADGLVKNEQEVGATRDESDMREIGRQVGPGLIEGAMAPAEAPVEQPQV